MQDRNSFGKDVVPFEPHPLDRPDRPTRPNADVTSQREEAALIGASDPVENYEPSYEQEYARTRVAWSKLLWLITTLACLLAVAQLVPYIAEQTSYAINRGKERAQYEMAGTVLADSPLGAFSDACQRISQRVGPSVVHIQTSDRMIDEVSVQPFGSFGRRQLQTGQGSGVIVDAGGYVVTNYHVIRGSQQIKVGLSDGRRVPATVVGMDLETDIAVLKISADKLIAAEWADSDTVEAGSLVWAMGSPFGLERSVTAGILSGKHRAGMAGTPYQDFLQTDAAVNPGNSGGPLVDVRGSVVGINTAIVGDAYQGISFAVPSQVARAVFERIRDEGRVSRGWLGVALEEIDESDLSLLKLESMRGVRVGQVVDQPAGGSPALKAGVAVGDVILQWNGKDVNSPADLTNIVGQTEIGTIVEMALWRDGQEMTLQVEVGRRPVMR